MTREERLRSTDMGYYFRISPEARGLNYDKFYVQGEAFTEGDEAYTSHNTNLLDVDGVVKNIMTTDYVKEELEGGGSCGGILSLAIKFVSVANNLRI